MCRAAVPIVVALLAVAAGARALEDPTRPPRRAPRPETEAPARELTAILGRGEARVAVIDGRRLRVGDAIGADTVDRIERTRVELRGPDGPIILTLFGPPVKTPAGVGKETR